jgi:methionyl-tRNA formyltransferase
MSYKVVFCGTPVFAVPALSALHSHPDFEVGHVFTQPDRPSGRGKKLKPSAVKIAAEDFGLNLSTPEKVSVPEIVQQLKNENYDVGVVVAYGQLLSQAFLDAFKFGCVNIHSSLLPRWRGAAPMQRAIMAGDRETGVSLQKVVKKLDAGDVIAETKIPLPLEMGSMELYTTLSQLGAQLLAQNLSPYLKGEIEPRPQAESQVTYAKKILKKEGAIDWSQSCEEIHNKIRGLDMGGPFASTTHKEKTLKLHKSLPHPCQHQVQEGMVVDVGADSFRVACGSGELEVFVVQPESKSRMSAADFIRGYHLKEGDVLV